VFSILALNILYAFTFDSLTVLAITVIFIFILVVRNFVLFSIACVLGLGTFVFILIYFSSAIELYKQGPYTLFGNVNLVMLQHPLLLIDGNSTWRLVFWYRMIVENFPMNLIGIGFGTPLIDYEPGLTTVSGGNTDEHDAHVIGAHNTYLTVAVRLGVLFLLFVLLVYAKVFKEYYNHFKYYTSRGYFIYFWAFFAISIIGLFNLTLESPIYASLYWVLLGFVARVIEIRKNEALQPIKQVEVRVKA
jgi:hypothetical protein